MEKLVSVIMSTYNTPKEYLKKAIESILKQTYKNIEFIIICDGEYKEYEYIRKFFKDGRIVLIFNKSNKGLPASLNEGIRIAKGEYIIRMDSDDICLPKRIITQVKYLEKHPNIKICAMYSKTFGDFNKKVKNYMNNPKEIQALLLFSCCIAHPTVAIRKNFLIENNLYYNEKFECSQDYELWSRASNNANIAIIKQYGLMYRVHSQQASQYKRNIQLKYTNEILRLNALKISTDKNEEIIKTFKILSFLIDISEENYIEVSNMIDYIVQKNEIMDKKALQKVLYNRYFFLLFKSRILKKRLINIIKISSVRKKIFQVYNLNFILWGIGKRIEEKWI